MLKPRFLNSVLNLLKYVFGISLHSLKNTRKMILFLNNSKYWPEIESQW